MTIYIANLDTQFTNQDLQNLFQPFGEVISAEIAIDSFTDKPRGFGYVEMKDETEANAAIKALHQKEVNGNKLIVEETEPKIARKGSYKVGNGAINVYRFRK